jgi:PadR family transcriptional regulator, regulatory protein PadR
MRKPEFIDMKGLLSFHIMWLIRQRSMCGEELIEELGKRRKDAPSPGTIYPALNKLREAGLLEKKRDDKKVIYSVTPKGIKDLDTAISYFKAVYGEIMERAGIFQSGGLVESGQITKDELEIDYI